ncbi:glutamine synthetase family protein [uncultured Pseudoteredinibacter sp.]|uniref:glutamine synthetase family protein n=1 Tax=uncultured Pseudoteredinibacter sp. TaxID=1641701 RepID=UPI00260D2F80|nr:glutamine synthetase family protein [uncultured Pseudoteredinibacter sp.]
MNTSSSIDPQLQQARDFLAANPDINTIEVFLCDYNGLLRGKLIPRENLEKVFKGNLKLPVTALSMDVWGRDLEEIVFATGDADGLCLPVPGSLQRVPWRPGTAQMQITMADMDAQDDDSDPRVILSNISQQYAAKGLRPVVAVEMEFFLLKAELNADGSPQHSSVEADGSASLGGQPYHLDSMIEQRELLDELRSACEALDLPADTFVKEAAPSQYEINLNHLPDPVAAADAAFLLKRVIREVCRKHGYIASFMAKPFGDEAGNGMHVHFSCIDEDGENIFSDGGEKGSAALQHAIAGTAATMKDCMAIFAPNLNSYRRFQAGCHAPTSPCWGYENRTVALRVPAGDAKARRIEHRIGGADCNPYLLLAAILAGALKGMEEKLPADAPIEGDAYSQVEPSLPQFWPESLSLFEQSEFIPATFGETFHHRYALCKRQELNEFHSRVTQLEYSSYLKCI